MKTAEAAPLPWTAGRLGDLDDDLADLQAAHGAVEAGGDTLADLVGRLVGVMEHLAADVAATEGRVVQVAPGRPVLRVIQGGRS